MESLEIPASEAKPMIDAAKAYIQKLNTTKTLKAISILQGAYIPPGLWSEVVTKLGENPEVWAMLALENGEMKIIFQGKAATGKVVYKYFNFTRPCPNMCPPPDGKD
ncbi:MAG: hypothetical protein AB8G11_21570 [Saprospiraceae bacterium]